MKFKFLFLFLFLYSGVVYATSVSVKIIINGVEVVIDIEQIAGEIKCDIAGGGTGGAICTASTPRLRWLGGCRMRDNMACETKLERALLDAVRACADLQDKAHECCHKPESCVGGGLAHALDSLGKMNTAIGTMKGGQAQCDAVQQTHGMYGGMQGLMGQQCSSKAQECSSQCSQQISTVDAAFREACGVSINSGESHKDSHTCDRKFYEHYTGMYKGQNEKGIKVGMVPEECERTGKESNRRIQDMGTNLGASLLASVQECEELAEKYQWDTSHWKGGGGGTYTEGGDVYTTATSGGQATSVGLPPGGTSPADTTLPPTNPKNPDDVAEIPGLTLGGGGNQKKKGKKLPEFGDINVKNAANPFDNEPDLEEANSPLGGESSQNMTGGLVGGTGGGSGGGIGGLGGGGGGGLGFGSYKGKNSRDPAKVALGLKTGGKFAGYGGGGSKNNKSSGRYKKNSKRKKSGKGFAELDLKKILPKGKQINHKTGKYGSPHESIFQRMSDRIQWMCRKEKINCR